MNRRVIKYSVGVLFVAALLIQFVPVDRTNPPVTREIVWDSEQTMTLARQSCYDCHSFETVWPWYGAVAPMSWLVAKDVREAREHLNFSAWDQPNESAAEIIEMVEDGEMPLRKYTLLHPKARLTDETRQALVRGMRATFAADPPVEKGDSESEEDHPHEPS